MRKYDIPYNPKGPASPYPAKPLQDMTLEEIKKKYLKMCAKSNGDLAVCSKCQSPCPEGKRAMQLLANEIYDDPPVPLYGGKTLIDWAKEENKRRKEQKEEQKVEEVKETKEPKAKQRIDDWWEKSLASGDQTAWIMKEYNMSKTQAKKKIYSYRYRKGLSDKNYPCRGHVKEEPVESVACAELKEKLEGDPIESKIEELMKIQEKHKKIMLDMQEQYEKAKANYEAISKKIDVLCSAMDIMNE